MNRYRFDPITGISSRWVDGQWVPLEQWQRRGWIRL
jgi:hypothetical protein